MAKHKDRDEATQARREGPEPESPFSGMPAMGDESTPPEDLPPPEGSAEPAAAPKPKGARASTERPGEEPERFVASQGRPPRPEDALERPAGAETAPVRTAPRPADPSQPLPRVCDQHERAYEGTARFKVRALIAGEPREPLYVLAEEGDEQGARDAYLKAQGLDRKRKVLDEKGELKEVLPPVDLFVVRLAD